MLKKQVIRAGIRLGLGVITVCVLGSMPALAESDVLERPALAYSRAATSVLLSITRAGGRLVACGERGIILLSDDNGNNWRQAKTPVSVSITSLYFSSPKQGWAAGHSGTVLHTNDGGEHWVKQLDGKIASTSSLNFARALADERVIASAERLVADGPDKPFLDVMFLDDRNGMIVGAYGLAFTTSDGGENWSPALTLIPNPKDKHLYKISAKGDEIVIVGEQGGVYWSGDRGKTFREASSPYPGSFFGVVQLEIYSALVFGLRGNAYLTANQGKTWKKINVGTANTLTAGMRLSDGSIVLLDETGLVLRSQDEGNSFNRVPLEKTSSLTGLVETKDGSLLLSGVRGLTSLKLPLNK